MAVKVYKHTDPGAPPHPSDTRGSMATLLRACLVTGYYLGEDITPPAGWEEVFESMNNFAVFRSLVGSMQIYQLDDNMPDDDVAYMRACESLASVDAATTGEWAQNYFGKQYPGYAQWTVIADEKTCYVILQSMYGNIIHGFGEFDSAVVEDPHNSFLAGHTYSDNLPSDNLHYAGMHYANALGQSGYIETHRTATGTFAGNGKIVEVADIVYPGGLSNVSPVAQANNDLGFYTSPVYISMDSAQEGGLKLIRGKLRGIYQPLAQYPKSHLEEYIDSETGKTMMCVTYGNDGSSSYQGSYMFDITGPW